MAVDNAGAVVRAAHAMSGDVANGPARDTERSGLWHLDELVTGAAGHDVPGG